MDWNDLLELDVVAFIIGLVVAVMTWYSVFVFDGLGWDTQPTSVKIVMVASSFAMGYFVSVLLINK